MIPSRPLTLGGIIEEAIRIVKKIYWRAAVLLLVFAAPGMVIMQLGFEDVIDGSEVVAQKFVDFSPESPKLFRDYFFTMRSSRTTSYYWLYFGYSDLFKVVDSVSAALKEEYPDTVSRNALSNRIDSIAKEYKSDFKAKASNIFFADMQTGFVLLIIGFVLYVLGLFGSMAAQYDLASRAFEERGFSFPAIIKFSLKRNMWLFIALFLFIMFGMLLGFGIVLGIAFAISKVLGELGVFAAFCLILYSGIRLMFSGVALVSEELTPLEAITRSFELTKKMFWRIVGILIVCGLLILIASTIIRIPFSIFLTPNLNWLIDFIRGKNFNVARSFQNIRSALHTWEALLIISALLTASFTPAFLVTFYYDLRTRKDGPLEYHEDGSEDNFKNTSSLENTNPAEGGA